MFRLGAATAIGAALGLDREVRGKAAGLRTHALVSLGSALVVVTAIQIVDGDRAAVTRVIQGIIAGIGFLGGGAILHARDSDDVRGLTTAASIWLVAGLGMACGGGEWVACLTTLALGVAVLVLGSPLERIVHRVFERKRQQGKVTPDKD